MQQRNIMHEFDTLRTSHRVPDETLEPNTKVPLRETKSSQTERRQDAKAKLWQHLKREVQRR
jgi:hypothetical protein